MGVVKFGHTIGIFSSDYQGRLDIGVSTMKKQQSASHDSWATKFRIRRIDGASVGEVRDDHIIGIFSDDSRYRLDIGTHSMKKTQDPSHLSWATELKIWPATQQNSRANQVINYSDIVGVFSARGGERLDIGSQCVNVQEASHESWATTLIIQGNDPIIEVGAIRSMNYNLTEAKKTNVVIEMVYNDSVNNTTNLKQQHKFGKTNTWTNTSTFENTFAFKAGIEVSGRAGIPFVAKGEIKVSGELSFSRMWGSSSSESKSVTWEANPYAEPMTKLSIFVTVSKSTIEVPYNMEADVKRLSGKWDRAHIPGIFKGRGGYEVTYNLTTSELDGNPPIEPSKTSVTSEPVFDSSLSVTF